MNCSVFIKPNLQRVYLLNRICHLCKYSKSMKTIETVEEDGPIKFTMSPAARHKASLSRQGVRKPDQRLSYEPMVILGSVAVFMIYFTILREENDLDKELGKTLYSRVSGLEEVQLKLNLKYNKEHNMSTKEIEDRLREIEVEKAAKSVS